MKKIAVFLAVIMALTIIPFSSFNALAATDGVYIYEVISESEKTCKIIGSNDGYLNRDVTIPAEINGYKVVEIGAHAFQDVENIKTVTISNGVKVIGEYAFLSCGSLAEVVLPSGVTNIGQGAFMECKKLGKINFPDSITNIGRNALYDTQFIQIEVKEPEEDSGEFEIGMGTITILNKSQWSGGMLYVGKHLIMCDPQKTGKVTIKDGTRTIAGDAFFWCDEVTGVTIPDSVVTIGEYAFYQCEKITSITIPNSVKSIEDSAFAQCYALKNVTIPSSVTKIGAGAFSGCNAFTGVTIPGSVKTIGMGAFSYCAGLKTVKINSGVKTLGNSAFYGCGALTSISIPDSVTSLGAQTLTKTAFYENDNNWSSKMLYVGKFLIKVSYDATGTVTIKQGTTVFADDAFSQADSISTVSIPASVTKISDGSFKRCSSLKAIKVSADNGSYTSVDDCLYNKAVTKLICLPQASLNKIYTAPETVTQIGNYSIYGSKNLTTVELNNKAVKLGTYTFYDCDALKSVTVSGKVSEIGKWAFAQSSGVTVYGQEDTILESYCKENDIKFAKISGADDILLGDANGDGKITSLDARWILQVAAELKTPTAYEEKAMDVNGDGKITSLDARYVLQIAAELL